MTVETKPGTTTVATEVPKGWWKRRRRRTEHTTPPVVVEVRIDVNRNDEQPADQTEPLPAAKSVANAIERVVTGEADVATHGVPPLIGHIGVAVRDRIDGIVGTAGALVEQRIESVIASANSQIDTLIEETVNQALDTVIQRVLEARLGKVLGVTIDLTKLEEQPADPSTGAESVGVIG